MEEAEALKWIFKSDYKEDGSIVFNGRVYSGPDVYLQIYHARSEEATVERGRVIDARVEIVEKITEEEFIKWKRSRGGVLLDKKGKTGREIWESCGETEADELVG